MSASFNLHVWTHQLSLKLVSGYKFTLTRGSCKHQGTKFKLKRDSDDLSCLVFAAANTVTLMYYSLEVITSGNVAEGETKVMWIGNTMHILNTVVAWLDVLISSPRRFGPRARLWTLMFSIIYVLWINVVRLQTGKFPYPFLDDLPYPSGILGVCFVGALVMHIFTYMGKFVSYCGKLVFGEFEEADPVWQIEERADAVRIQRKQEKLNNLYGDIKVE